MRTNESIEPGARRREFLRMLCGGAAAAIATKPAASPAAEAAGLPRGKIGDLELSRLMLGTNHITFYMHSRDLRYVDQLSRHYNTDEKIIETFAAAEANGINTFMTHGDPKIESLFKRYRSQRGGKMKWIVAPWFDGPATQQNAVFPLRQRTDDQFRVLVVDGGALTTDVAWQRVAGWNAELDRGAAMRAKIHEISLDERFLNSNVLSDSGSDAQATYHFACYRFCEIRGQAAGHCARGFTDVRHCAE